MSEEALQIAEKRKEAKGKGEKERYTHLNAEFQRTAERDKKAFLSNQCKEIEEDNRMARLEISSRKLVSKGTFHAKMSTINDKNGMDLIEAEDIKKNNIPRNKPTYKEIKDLYSRNYKILMKEIEEDINRWKKYTMFMEWKNQYSI